MIELAVFGGLSVTAIATVIGVARSAVLMQLADGMRGPPAIAGRPGGDAC
jgi:hypothetical protein